MSPNATRSPASPGTRWRPRRGRRQVSINSDDPPMFEIEAYVAGYGLEVRG